MWHTVRMKSETSWKLEWKWKWSIIERRKRNMAPKSCQSRGEGEIFLQCLENREEKGNFFSRISKIEKRKRNFSQKSWQSRGEREFPDKNLKKREGKEKFFHKFLKIERRTRHENSFLQLERENSESFLFENFSRARLLSRTVDASLREKTIVVGVFHTPSLLWWLQSEYQTYAVAGHEKMEFFFKIAPADCWLYQVTFAGYQWGELRRFLLYLLPEVKFNSWRILFPSE